MSNSSDWFGQPVGTEAQVVKTKQAVHPRADIDPGMGIPMGFQFDPEFTVSSVHDGGNGGTWSSTRGELTDPFFNPGQMG